MSIFDIVIPNYKCPYKVGDSKTLLEPEYSNVVKCNYENKMFRAHKCIAESCPIRASHSIQYD